MTAEEIIRSHSSQGAALRQRFFEHNGKKVQEAAFAIALSLARGGKLLLCGNGGSAADCQHVAAEFVNQFQLQRPGLPAIALTTDTSALTAIGNDRGYEAVFSRQVQALGNPGDVLLAISTSGKSANVLRACAEARSRKLVVIGLCGSGDGMAGLCDWLLAVEDRRTPLIQEVHLAIQHLLCRLVDYYLFENPGEISGALHGPREE